MKTIILCGGIYRLKEETEFKPKPMVQLGENLFFDIQWILIASLNI